MKGLKHGLFSLLALLFVACTNPADGTATVPTASPTSETTKEADPAVVAPAPTETPTTEVEQPTQEPAIEPTEEDNGATESEELAAEVETPLPVPGPMEEVVEAGEPQDITIEAADGLTLTSTFYPGSGPGPWSGVMLLHMNGGRRQDWSEVAPQLADQGYAILAVDMRGHGQTGGAKDWEKARDDLQQAWSYLAGRQDVNEGQTAVVGASIGANMALVTGADQPAIKTVVLLSPGLDYFGVTTDDKMVTYGERPALIVASEEDVLAANSSRVLAELALGETTLQMYDGAGHGTRMFDARPELTSLILDWLDKHAKGEAPVSLDDDGGELDELPNPSLFGVSWHDRSAYEAGLISAEKSSLDELPGASVYHMELSISPDLQSVSGRQEVLFTNQEQESLDDVFFHLYPNLLGGQITLGGLTVNGEAAEPEYSSHLIVTSPPTSSAAIQRDWVNTAMRVPLSSPLAPGESAVITMDFEVEVPTEGGNNYGVFATVDDVLALAHFYPQIAVYDDEGWNIEPPPPNADVTYADSSFYQVRVTAPVDQVLVASGIEVDRQSTDQEQTLTLVAGPVRDFYLASSDRYVLTSQQVGETTVNSYGFPEFKERNDLALDYAAGALESLNARLGDYPFTEFDVAPTPNLALGVEYPGAVVIRSALYDPEALVNEIPSGFFLEGTVAHEVAHQWFYSAIGNDQLDEPWLDESLTQYATYLYFVDRYGIAAAEGFRRSFFDRWNRVELVATPIGLPAGFYSGPSYSAIIYGRGPLFFEALSEQMGQETFDAFLRDYFQQNKWGIVSGERLKALAEEHCDCDLTRLFADWVGGP